MFRRVAVSAAASVRLPHTQSVGEGPGPWGSSDTGAARTESPAWPCWADGRLVVGGKLMAVANCCLNRGKVGAG